MRESRSPAQYDAAALGKFPPAPIDPSCADSAVTMESGCGIWLKVGGDGGDGGELSTTVATVAVGGGGFSGMLDMPST